jgi:hypothetical protein
MVRYALILSIAVAGCGMPTPTGDVEEDLADGPPTAHVRFTKGASKAPLELIDHGGKVLTTSHTYAIWWGKTADFPSDSSALEDLLAGFGGSRYLAIANQYLRGGTATSKYITAFNDTSAPPSRSPSTRTIVNEACKVIGAHGRKPDTDALYVVFTSNYPSNVDFCAWHDHGSCNGVDIQVAYLPNNGGVSGCDPGNLFNCNSFSQGTRANADSLAHEFMETVTDPDITAWLDKQGSEIGDKCDFVYGSCVTVGRDSWQIQEEWSNSAKGCVQKL